MLMGVLCVIFIFIAVPPVFNFIYGDVYSGSVTILRILLVCVPFRIFDTLYLPIFNSIKKYKYIQVTNVAQVLLNILLDIVLVSLYGFIGAAVATTISYILRSLINLIYFNKIKYIVI